MRKKALIFGFTGHHHTGDFLPGVKGDISEAKSFLMSNLGGGWLEKEVTDLLNPSREEVNEWIQTAINCDYSVIIYSGHGWKDRLGRQYLSLEDEESIALSELPKHNKQLLIIDACRSSIDDNDTAVAKVLHESDSRRQSTARALYEKVITEAESGRVVIYATQDNTSAGDEDGAVFLRLLFEVCKEWEESGSESVLNASRAYSLCYEIMEGISSVNGTTQLPDIRGAIKRNRHYPLAVNPTVRSAEWKTHRASELLERLNRSTI